MNNKQNISLIIKLSIVLVFAVILVSGGTYAYWAWISDTNKVVGFQTIDGIEDYIIYDAGDSHFVGDFQPKTTFCQSVSTTLSVAKTSEASDINLEATIYMDINAIGTNIASSNSVYWVVTESDDNIRCSDDLATSPGVISYGTFNGKSAGDSFALTSNKKIEITTNAKQFTVWIWMDYYGSNLTSLTGETIDANVWTKIDMLDDNNSDSLNAVGDAYAIYSADDNSLRFYRSETLIEVGSTYNGLTATAVYTGFEEYTGVDDSDYVHSGVVLWEDYAETITSVIVEDDIYPINRTSYWFRDFLNCENFEVSKLNTSRVKNMNSMFYNAGSNVTTFTLTGLENWDVSNVTNMHYMFREAGYSATTWSIGDISGWDTSSARLMSNMFQSAGESATTWSIGDISAWNVSNVTNMGFMFSNAGYSATTWSIGDISAWNVSNVTDMGYMFSSAGQTATDWSLDLRGWNVLNVTDYGSFDSNNEGKILLPLWGVDPEDGIYAIRYTCDYLGGYDRLSTYFVTECNDGVCAYTKKYGLNNTFDFSLDYSGVPTWSVSESSLCTTSMCGACDNDWQMYVGSANVGCYSGASKTTSLVTTFGTGKCSHLLTDIMITPYRTQYNGTNYVWFYDSNYNCYIYNGDLTTTCS